MKGLLHAESLREAVVKATLVSSLGFWLGAIFLASFNAFTENPNDLWAIPILFFFYTVISWPFFAFGICVFGMPVAYLARRSSQWRGWIVIAPLLGSVAGTLVLNTITMGDRPAWTALDAWLSLYGVATGGWAGLVFWWYARDALRGDGDYADEAEK